MSGTVPPLARSLPQTGVGAGLNTQGMISPANPFVNPDGTLSPPSFRFLFSLLQAIVDLQNEVTVLQQRLTAGGL